MREEFFLKKTSYDIHEGPIALSDVRFGTRWTKRGIEEGLEAVVQPIVEMTEGLSRRGCTAYSNGRLGQGSNGGNRAEAPHFSR